MPSSFDLRPVQITHHPTQRIDSSISDLPKLTWDELLSGFSRAMKVAFGVDITSATGLATSIRDDTGIDLVAMGQMIDLLFGPLYDGTASSLTPEAIWHWVTTNHLKNWLLAADLPGFEGLDLEQPRAVLTAILRAAGNLSSGIRAALLGVIPIGLLDDDQPTLLLEGGYDTAETISVNSEFYWRGDDGVTGTNPVGSAWVDCDGTTHALVTDYVAVRPGWTIKISGHVKRDGIDAAANSHAVSLRVLPFAEKGIPHGSGVRLASVASPAGSADWTLIQSDEWEVPEGVRWLVVEANVDEAATAGRAGFDEVGMQSVRLIPQRYTKNLPEDLTSLLNLMGSMVDQWLTRLGIEPTGGLMDRIFDLGDELQLMQERGEDSWEALADKLGISDWDDWLAAQWDTFRADLLSNPGSLLGQLGMGQTTGLSSAINEMNQVRDLLAGYVVTPINAAVQDIKTWLTNQTSQISAANGNLLSLANSILSALRGVPVVGGAIADRLEDVLEDLGVLRSTATAAQTKADEVQAGIINGWAGTTTTGTDIDVYDTIAAIRAMVGNEGYIRQGFTSSQRWVIPTGVTEIVSIAISSGQNGAPGSDPGGIGGMGGGFKVTALDPATLDALYLQVGTGGNPTRIRNDNASGAILSEAVPGGGGAMSTSFGYTSSSSGAGAGGNGGRGFTTSAERLPGNPGISTPAAVGGAGGISSSEDGAWGAPGGSVSASAIVPCGGAGGGGGEGGGYSGGVTIGNGGRGGDGGFPGGGGGGGGGRGTFAGFNGSQGSGGNGAAGLVIIFYR